LQRIRKSPEREAYTDAGTELEIFLDDSWYRIYHSEKSPGKFPELYNKPVTERQRYTEEGGRALETEAKTTFEELKKSRKPSIVLLDSQNGESYIISWQYVPDYKLWIHYHMPTSMR